MKKILSIMILALILVVCVECNTGEEIQLHQPREEIRQIKLVYSPRQQHHILYNLDESEFMPFLDAFERLKMHKHFSPFGEYGTYYVQIVYADGAIENRGTLSQHYKSAESDEFDGWYGIDEDMLYRLFSEYVDLS